MGKNVATNVGDDPLAECDDEIVAAGGRRRQQRRHQNQCREILGDDVGARRLEAVIDHAPHGHRQGQSRRCGDDQRYDGADRQFPVAGDVGKKAPERPDRTLARVSTDTDIRHERFLWPLAGHALRYMRLPRPCDSIPADV